MSGPGQPSGGLNAALGIEGFERLAEDRARARMPVTDAVMQPYGIVHGGALAALAETVSSRATHESVEADGMYAVGMANSTSFLRPVSSGVVYADAVVRHRGRTTWVWDIELRDGDDRLCALCRMTVAVRPRG